ncbi:MAG: YihY/virulence factor BrkB family protein [Lachnospiraceae bacterium]|nr:YihY/virulence factor BrkB family protein [Lachnospiraceae bacterium]
MKKKYIDIGRDFSLRIRGKDIPSYAASASFFLILSFVPMIALICGILPYTPLTEDFLLRVVLEWSPDAMDGVLDSIIRQVYESSAGIVTISIFATLWSAGKGVMALVQGLNRINHVKEQRNMLVIRLWSCFYTTILLLGLVLSLVVLVFGDRLLERVRSVYPSVVQPLIDLVMRPRALYAVLLLTFVFAALYRFLPNAKLKYREQLPGALLAAIMWTVFSYVFSLYVSNSKYLSLYGSMTTLVITMLWLYGCMYLFLVCAYLNRFFRPINLVLVYPNKKKKKSASTAGPAPETDPGNEEKV